MHRTQDLENRATRHAPAPWLPTRQRQSNSWSKLLARLQEADPELYDLLANSPSLEECRERLYRALNRREGELQARTSSLHPLEHDMARKSVRILKDIVAPRNEARAGFSTLEAIWHMVRTGSPKGQPVEEGLVLEFVHLFRGIRGRSGVARGWLEPAGAELPDCGSATAGSGRAAGTARSAHLDELAAEMWARVSRYPSGLNPRVVAQRRANRQRILAFLGGSQDDWEDPRWQLRHLFAGPEALPRLEELISLTPQEREAIAACVDHGVPFGITPYYLSLMDLDATDRRHDRQVRAQVIPPLLYVQRMIEHQEDREHYFDFMGEHDTSPVDLVTRRYAAIAILKGYDTCPQICVYCQRNWEITGPMEAGALPGRERLDAALDWFAEHRELREVLITGGDPFFLGDSRIGYMLRRLSAMDHIVQIRWGTRAPVTMPMRITDSLARLLGGAIDPGRRNVAVVTHVQSAMEVTPEMAAAVHRLRRQGLQVYNQQVFTLHTSRRFQTVANRLALKKIGVDPYYTFYPKGKEETSHYTTPLARILQERKEEARLLPGSFRTDEPVFNVPRLGKNHVRASQDRELIGIRPDGRRVYVWHPWEKGITPTDPWLYVDNSIHRYLQDLKRMGEDPADYESIWYYY
jgi:lysine 2,3-aminomutase